LDLVGPVCDLFELMRGGRQLDDPEVLTAARTVLDRYDMNRAEFEARAVLRPDPTDIAGGWRSFFEDLRGLPK
jgi:hypothetical protein